MSRTHLLRMTRITHVGFVDKGANYECDTDGDCHGATIEFYKSADGRDLLQPHQGSDMENVLKDLPADVLGILQTRQTAIEKIAGTSATKPSGDAWAEVEALAKVMVEKRLAPTQAQAIAKVLEENTELYDVYVSEQG